MHIVLDAMGSDTHPHPELEACARAVQEWADPITLVGPEPILRPALAAQGVGPEKVRVVHAPDVLEMTDKPAHTAKEKAMTSMAVGMDLLKDGSADAFVTAGNTGGAMATALFRLGRIRGVKRPALAPVFPVLNGKCVVIDIGANVDCKPEYLLQFAILGSLYARTVLGVQSPRIGLLSNGEEPGKGNELIQSSFPLLNNSGLDFIGNVEPKEVYAGRADVVVTDGFYGNIFLKTSEAVARFLMQLIRDHIKASPLTTVGGLLARPAFRRVARIMDPSEYGAVPLLGVQGLVFIGHGRSDAKAILSAIRVARDAVRGGLLQAVEAGIRSRFPRAAGSD
jgi:glycerol-3-phosphate acyltransferase PlsX